MNSAVIICGDQVLYRRDAAFAASEPIFEGLGLAQLFSSRHVVHVLCETDKAQHAEMWMRLNGLKEVIVHTSSEVAACKDEEDYYDKAIKKIRASGPVSLVVLPNGHDEIKHYLANAGLYTLIFVRPGTINSEPIRPTWHERSSALKAGILDQVERENTNASEEY